MAMSKPFPLRASASSSGVTSHGPMEDAKSFPLAGPRRTVVSRPSPSCPIAFADVKRFAEHQKTLTTGGAGVNPQALVEPVATWDLPKVQCLLFTLMAASPDMKAKDGFEPLLLLRALQQSGSPLARDGALHTSGAQVVVQAERPVSTAGPELEQRRREEGKGTRLTDRV